MAAKQHLDVVIVVHWVATRGAGVAERRQGTAVAARPPASVWQSRVGSAGLAGGACRHRRGVGSGSMCASPGQTM